MAVTFLLSFRSAAEKPAATPGAHLTDQTPTVRIAVLTLFHPKILVINTPGTNPITLTYPESLTLPTGLITLTVPGKLTRTYRGALKVIPRNGSLLPILTLDTEQAVASIVSAESSPRAPFEALKAQAIVSRSYLLATPPGPLYDATDTTHDQYLRAAPPASSAAARATVATRNIVLTWRPGTSPLIVHAMYSRSCGGHTRPHPTADPDDYPFYAVTCQYCLRHPEQWTRNLSEPPKSESARIAYNRTHGWSAIPSNTHTQSGKILEGQGTGHGIGLCQLGAADLAAHGQTAAQILAHYYPNTTLRTLP